MTSIVVVVSFVGEYSNDIVVLSSSKWAARPVVPVPLAVRKVDPTSNI
jgi:hypothetical protein